VQLRNKKWVEFVPRDPDQNAVAEKFYIKAGKGGQKKFRAGQEEVHLALSTELVVEIEQHIEEVESGGKDQAKPNAQPASDSHWRDESSLAEGTTFARVSIKSFILRSYLQCSMFMQINAPSIPLHDTASPIPPLSSTSTSTKQRKRTFSAVEPSSLVPASFSLDQDRLRLALIGVREPGKKFVRELCAFTSGQPIPQLN
jgi:hypothetical protein